LFATPQAGRFADANAAYGRALLLLNATTTRDDADASFLEARVFSNRAMTSRRCARFDDALDDATNARRVCETFQSLKNASGDLRFERLLVKTMCAQADALVNLERAWEACVVLRAALRRLGVSRAEEEEEEENKTNFVGEKNRDVAEISARLRLAISRVPMTTLCDHWSFAIESAVGRSTDVFGVSTNPQPLSARSAGRLMRPASLTRREDRLSAAESSRRLRDQLAGAEQVWRAFTAEAWIRACANFAITKDDQTSDEETYSKRFPFGVGSFARFALYRARAVAHRGKGDVAQFVCDARASAAYAPDRFQKQRGEKQTISLETLETIETDPSVSSSESQTMEKTEKAMRLVGPSARLAAEARALLAEAYEAVSDFAERENARAFTSSKRSATRHFLDETDLDDVSCHSGSVGFIEGDTKGALSGRVILSPAGEGGRQDALVVDAGVAAAVEWRRATEFDGFEASYVRRLRVACEKHLSGFGSGLRDALFSAGGSDAALLWLEEDKWRHAPEYVRPRPKYYYFYEMMREKIEAHYPPGTLPAPVMDKLLSTDADELDLLLQYPEAIRGQTEEYLAVLREEGAEALGTYKTPTLTWDEVRALKGGDGVVGLGASGETTGAESVRELAKPRTKSFSSSLPTLPTLDEDESSSHDVASSCRSVGSSALRSAKAKMDRAKAFAEAYAVDSGKEKKQSSSFDDPECVSDPDEPEEDTDRAAVGAGGDDGLTDREKRGLTDGDGEGDGDGDVYGEDGRPLATLPPDQFRARAARLPSTRQTKDPHEERSPRAERARRAAARFAATEVKAMDEMD
jgi:hypothetical protein